MRTALFLLIASLSVFTAIAQTDDEQDTAPALSKTTIDHKHELGVFGQTNPYGNGNEDMNFAGLQYKTWANEHLGLRFLAAYSDYNFKSSKFYQGASSDTSVSKWAQTHISLGVIGGGIEAQRRFFKRVYLFAAIEMRVGYGNGTIDTSIEKAYTYTTPSTPQMPSATYSAVYGYGAGRGNANMFYLGVSPSIGAKLQFNRLCIGLEMQAAQLSVKSIKYDNAPSYGVTDFELGNISHRFFINFRF